MTLAEISNPHEKEEPRTEVIGFAKQWNELATTPRPDQMDVLN
jgi:hypothetical protein